MTIPIIAIAEIEEAVTEDRLLQRAMSDCLEALTRFAILGRPIPNAITRLDELRQMFDELRPLLEKVRQP